uniref:Uncharacterized protein n=1 Tax=Aegilops tauschii subsp. strangulata TaxID=200361 RepID=A0A453PM74_AEGTS
MSVSLQFVVCLLSIVDNTKLVTEIIIEELTKQLKELTFDKVKGIPRI